MPRVFLSLGSNLGDRGRHLEAALRHLGEDSAVRVVACSRVYETEPWPTRGIPQGGWYLNRAVEIETNLSPVELLTRVKLIERLEGREPLPPHQRTDYAPRPLDIDILLYGDEVMSQDELQIPHPLMHERRFVLLPLAEIAPEVEHPTLYQVVRELLAESLDDGSVHPYTV